LRAGEALRLAPDYGHFAATPELTQDSLHGLTALDIRDDGLHLIEPEPPQTPAGLSIALRAGLVQMTAETIQDAEPDFDVVPLGETDGPEMFALAQLARPGPFARHTHRLGGFIGVRQDGRLVAIAGERMKPEGFCEVSGVCTHPDHRGRGYASALMRIVARGIIERGETPFLHAIETNTGAIALYETLGFRLRRVMSLTVLKPSRPAP
jgi:hypothetical protein